MVEETLLCSGRLIVGGEASGPLVALQEPVSFWGGVDDDTGEIIDGHHPQRGVSLAGSALLMGATRGSSSSSSTFLECIRRGTAPAVLLLTETDPLLVVAVAAAWEIYGRGPSVVVLSEPPDVVGVTSIRLDATGCVYAIRDFVPKSLTTNI
jgi:predicted aconitase with swiveling domain